MEGDHIGIAMVRQRCGGISQMTIWRWLNDPASTFPKPVYIYRRRYWREAEVLAWLEDRPPARPPDLAKVAADRVQARKPVIA